MGISFSFFRHFLFSIGQIPAPAPNSMTHNHIHNLCVLVEVTNKIFFFYEKKMSKAEMEADVLNRYHEQPAKCCAMTIA